MHGVECLLSPKVFTRDAIFKCLYWFSANYITEFDEVDGKFRVRLQVKNEKKLSDTERNELFHTLNQSLVDYSLRDIVTKETQTIRELITAKAFSHGQYDEKPPGEISDPVGFSLD